jgi:hypothetical protein
MMSMVAKYGAALAASALMTAIGFGLVAGASIDLLFQPHYWVVSVSLAGLSGLVMGNGIGGVERRSNVVRLTPKGPGPAVVALAA